MGRAFESTEWSVVLAARDGETSCARAALEQLCAAYWQPLYAFARRLGCPADEAADLTQAFFATFLEKHYLDDVRPGLGRFRAFLLASMRHFLANEWDRRKAAKRAGDFAHVSLDFLVAERHFVAEQTRARSPEAEFERRWALAIVARALCRLQRLEEEAGRAAQFGELSGLLTDEITDRYREIGERLGMTPGAVKVAVHRLRRRFGEQLRAEIAVTVVDPLEVDDELRHLLRSLS